MVPRADFFGLGFLVRKRAVLELIEERTRDGEETVIPPPDSVVEWIRAVDPDVILVSPLVTDASAQTDVVKAAQAAGLPVALLGATGAW